MSQEPLPPPAADPLDLSRRDFVKTGLLAAGASLAPAALVPPPAEARGISTLAYLSAVDQLRLFRAHRLSPVEVLQAQIELIERRNPCVNCITYRHFDEAMQQAKESEQRYVQGNPLPMDGLTVAVKDEGDHVGWVTTMGSLVFADNLPSKENSPHLDKLIEAGAVMHIQTTVPEFYLAATTWTRLWGITRNPWNVEFSPGGSSGGSGVALAAGFTTLATGSDMAGSIRIPASQCGLYGFKPPFGRVATSEVSYETYGPLARTFQDMRLMQQVLSGPDPRVHSSLRPKLDYPETYPDVRGWRVAVDYATGIEELDKSVGDGLATAIAVLRDLGCTVETVDVGFRFAHPDGRNDFATFVKGLLSTSTGGLLREVTTGKEALLTRYVSLAVSMFFKETGPLQLLAADDLTKTYHLAVQGEVFSPPPAGFRALIMPTMTTPLVPADFQIDASKDVFVINGRQVSGARYLATYPWNLLSRYPVVNVPIGRSTNGVPVGMQIIGNTFDDLTAFQLASAYSQAATPFFAGRNFPDFRNSVCLA